MRDRIVAKQLNWGGLNKNTAEEKPTETPSDSNYASKADFFELRRQLQVL